MQCTHEHARMHERMCVRIHTLRQLVKTNHVLVGKLKHSNVIVGKSVPRADKQEQSCTLI